MEPFKNIFNKEAVKKIAKTITLEYRGFNRKAFEKDVLLDLENLELKQRVKLLSFYLNKYLTKDYNKNIKILTATLAPSFEHKNQKWEGKESDKISGFLVWPYTQFIEDYGLEYLDISMNALYEMTQRFTAEFSLRPFLIKYKKTIYTQYLNLWVKDKSKHVRRLVSEGTRPQLPWGIKVKWISENPDYNLSLLDKLKNDESEYVRKSVANHLNDITKLSPEMVLNYLKDWDQEDKKILRIIRHATRTLLKEGNTKALKLNGFTTNPKLKLKRTKLSPVKIKEGESLELRCEIESQSKKKQKLLVDYIIHYPKKNNKISTKVYRFKELVLKPQETIKLEKKISFKKVTTRIHYPGSYKLEIKICNNVLVHKKFKLLDS